MHGGPPSFFNPPASDSDRQMFQFAMGLPGIPADGITSMGLPGEPTGEEMRAAQEAVRFHKTVKLKSTHVRTFDFSVPEQVAQYEVLYLELYKKVQLRQISPPIIDERFVEDPARPRWVLHMRWHEYDLEVTDNTLKPKPETARWPSLQPTPADS
jgi:hypothetical protein